MLSRLMQQQDCFALCSIGVRKLGRKRFRVNASQRRAKEGRPFSDESAPWELERENLGNEDVRNRVRHVKLPEPTDYGPRYGSELYTKSPRARMKPGFLERDPWKAQTGTGGSRAGIHSPEGQGSRIQARSYFTSEQGTSAYREQKNSFPRGAYGAPDVSDGRFTTNKDKLGRATEILSALGTSAPQTDTFQSDRLFGASQVSSEPDSRGAKTSMGSANEILSVLDTIKLPGGRSSEDDAKIASRFIQQGPGSRKWATRDGIPLPFWKQKVIQKKVKVAAERDKLDAGLDETAYLSEHWKRSRISWMLEEIPRLDPRQTVKILNSQIKWLRNRDISIICHRLLNDDSYIRAHRVLKWASQRPWFQVDFELVTKMANLLGATGKVGRTRDMFDMLIKAAYVPRESTFTALIRAYLDDGRVSFVEEAWKLYNRMIRFGHYEPPPVVKFTMLKYLTEYGKISLKWVDRADVVYRNIREANLTCNTEMYESLVVLHAVKGDEEKVNSLVEDMRLTGVQLSPLMFGAIIRVCSKTGNYEKAEAVFNQLKEKEEEPDWRYYVALIEAYGKAGLHQKALELFKQVETSVNCPLSLPYKAVIEVMAAADQIKTAEKLLSKLNMGTVRCQIMQSAFNAVMDMYIRNGMSYKVEPTFEDMKMRGCRPNHEATNLLLKSYVELGELEKADKFYEKMLNRDFIKPDAGTYEIMIGVYGRLKDNNKVKKVFERLTECKQPVPEEFQLYVDAAVEKSWIIQATQYCQPKLNLTERGMIVGALLGGARIKPVNRRSYEVHFEQAANSYRGQILIKHLYERFAGWAVHSPKVVTAKAAPGTNEDLGTSPTTLEDYDDDDDDESVIHFHTMGHVKFKFYAEQYRPEGFAKIPRLIHRWLNPVSLAYWYMYSGRKSTNPAGIILNCAPYTYLETSLVGEALRGRTMRCSVKKDDNEKFYLLLVGESGDWLWKHMEPYILPELVPLLRPDSYDPDRFREERAEMQTFHLSGRIGGAVSAAEEEGSQEECESQRGDVEDEEEDEEYRSSKLSRGSGFGFDEEEDDEDEDDF